VNIGPILTELCHYTGPPKRAAGQKKTRGKILAFSRKARKRMALRVNDMPILPNLFTTNTFPDDVMQDLSEQERIGFCSRVLKNWTRRVRRAWPEFDGIWRKEIKRRRRGKLRGQLVPHIHTLGFMPGLTEEAREKVQLEWVRLWHETIRTEHPDAKRVDGNEKAFVLLQEPDVVASYMLKYAAKLESHKGNPEVESIGRCWGRIGKGKGGGIKTLVLTWREALDLRRYLMRFSAAQYTVGKGARKAAWVARMEKKRVFKPGEWEREKEKAEEEERGRRGSLKTHLRNISRFRTYLHMDKGTFLDFLWLVKNRT
jgi:hypothetical protein